MIFERTKHFLGRQWLAFLAYLQIRYPRAYRTYVRVAPVVSFATSVYTLALAAVATIMLAVSIIAIGVDRLLRTLSLLFDRLMSILWQCIGFLIAFIDLLLLPLRWLGNWLSMLLHILTDGLIDFLGPVLVWLLENWGWLMALLGSMTGLHIFYGIVVFGAVGLTLENRKISLHGLKSSSGLLFFSAYCGFVILALIGAGGEDNVGRAESLLVIQITFYAAYLAMYGVYRRVMYERSRRERRQQHLLPSP